MIWDLIQQTQFDKYFSNPTLTITTLLLDENIITELKNQNPKLLDYIAQHKKQFITELIEYTVVMPSQNDSYDRGHKLPYISSELLAIDSELIYQQFFANGAGEGENEFWAQLIHFLETSAAENEILMGYFEKVINNLYNGNKIKTTQVVAHHLPKFARLLRNGSIGDILKKSIILLNTQEGAVLAQRQAILEEVVYQLVTGDEEVKAICSDVLTEVINKFQAFSSGDVLIQKLLNSQQLHRIYETQHSPAINDLLVSLVKKSQQRIVNENDVSVRILTLPSLHLQNLSKYLKMEVQSLNQLLTNDAYIINQNKVLVRKSNKKIYSILALVSLAIEEELAEFITSKFINNLWNLIILYPYNNILHVNVLKIFNSILKTSPPQAKSIFFDRHEEYLLELSKSNFQMFRPLIFTVWKQTRIYPTVTTDQEVLQTFTNFAQQHLHPLLKYEINQHLVHHHANHNKLIVDEEDKQEKKATTQSQQPNEHSFVPHPQPIEAYSPPKQVEQSPPKDEFDFFTGWETEQKEAKPIQAPKTGLFDDFSNFF